ncbi:hypothetical protein ACHAPF_005057 [Botrytis cinerea]
MTSNKKKRSTPHKSPRKPHTASKTHKSPREKVAPARQSLSSLPILPQKNAEIAPPILPPTRRILFPQSLKKSNSQQPFPSPHAVKTEHPKTKKHTLSSPAAKFSDDRPLKKQCLSSPSPAKRTKLLPVTPERVNGREITISSSDEEDENEIEIEDDTPSPPSQKRKSNTMVDVAGSHKKTSPSKTSVAIVIPLKQQPSSSFSTLHPNSPAVQKIDITVLRLEKEELQQRLDASAQQAQKAANDIKKWEERCKETTDIQDNLNRLLRAEIEDKERLQERLKSLQKQTHILNLSAKNWEKKWKKADDENKSLRKRLDAKFNMKTRKEDEATTDTEQWQHRYTSECEKTIKLHQELKQLKTNPEPEPPHLTQKIAKLELELSNLKSEHQNPPKSKETPSEEEEEEEEEEEKHLESTPTPAPTHPANQITQLQETLQRKTQLITNLSQATQTHSPSRSSLHLQNASSPTHSQSTLKSVPTKAPTQITKTRSELLDQNEEISILRTENEELNHQITSLKTQSPSPSPFQMLERLTADLLDKNEEISILHREFAEQIRTLEREVKVKDAGLQKMGMLVAGWVLKWRSLGGEGEGGGGGEGKLPAVKGLGICVDGARM